MPDTNLTPEQQQIVGIMARVRCPVDATALLDIIDDLDKRLTRAETFRGAVLAWCNELKDQANA